MTLEEIQLDNSKKFNELPFEVRYLTTMVECSHRITEFKQRQKEIMLKAKAECRKIDQSIVILQAELIKPSPTKG